VYVSRTGTAAVRVYARAQRRPVILECNGCCRTAEGPRRAVLSCAGAYVSGADGSNDCPLGSGRIETEAACRTAAAAAGKSVPSVNNNDWDPRGCFYYNYEAYFNKHRVGAGLSGRQLLCTTGARDSLTARVRTGYSKGTRRVLTRYSKGTQRVLSGYSQGTRRVLAGYSQKGPLSTG
jgi:hypothetical protein